ncbi:MAG: phosphoribosyltransferase [Sulfuricurvum sp.]
MIHYNCEQFMSDIQHLGRLCDSFEADTVVGIARGGVTLAHALCVNLDVRNLQSIRMESYDGQSQRSDVKIFGSCDFSRSKRVLIVDDIVDSGKTLSTLLSLFSNQYPDITFKSATLYTKSSALIQPDYSLYEAYDWIDFFWERDYLKAN